MSTPVLPTVIRSAAIFTLNGYAYYFDQSGATVQINRQTEQTLDDFFGRLGETAHGSPVVDITFTPTGMIRSLDKPFPYGPSNLVAGWYAGQSIFTGSGTFLTKDGKQTLYARAGILKSPTLYLNPRKQIFGPMTIRCVNQISVQPTDAAALKTLSAVAFADATFDETKIVKDIYTASLGARTAPFNAMGARTGFEIEPTYQTEDIDDVNVGLADTLLNSIAWKVRFAPNNLAEADLDALANLQGIGAIIAGQDVAMLNEDLIIDSDFLTVTLPKAGVVKSENGFGVKKDRNGMVEFVNKMAFTAGVPNPLISLLIN
ncbi:MAG: hypothetical protein KGL39_50975 [Patescibacteria group bacterium]|nr:hypothetical protein [Patescibacteria group bacterium]